jgi:hypothetical protein
LAVCSASSATGDVTTVVVMSAAMAHPTALRARPECAGF